MLITPTRSQDVLWGLTQSRGPKGGGTAFSVKTIGADFTLHYTFELKPGPPSNSLIQGRDGYLYGMTERGGKTDGGTIYKMSPDGSGFTELKSFHFFNDGASPRGSLLEGEDGALYGMTFIGGAYLQGTIFKIDPDGQNFTVLRSLADYYGSLPFGSLIQGSDGYLYGMTWKGGKYGAGIIFKISPDGTDFKLLKSFELKHGGYPYGDLLEGNDGFLYGMTREGGGVYENDSTVFHGGGDGTIFKIGLNGSGFKVIKVFDESVDGKNPEGSLIEGSNGFLYGMTTGMTSKNGGITYKYGTIFKIAPDGSGFKVLKEFDLFNDGGNPEFSLIEGKDSKLYGMAHWGPLHMGSSSV